METGGTTIHGLFEAQAARTPGATAVVAGAVSLTYAELDARANRLAHHLLAMGVGPDRLVGVCLGRSVDLAVALLGVLKAGAGCVPLDPSYPAARLGFMVEDAAVAAVVSSAAVADRLPAIAVPVVRIDADAARWTSRPTTRPTPAVGPQQVAYVIYTSGSTGTPKGVLLTHAGLVNHARGVLEVYGLEDKDRVLQLCSIGFDASIEEMFPTWAAGAAVVFRSDDALLLGRDWLRWLRAERISVMELPTSYWHEWTRDLEAMGETVPDHLRLVVVGGDRALARMYRTWLALGGRRCRWVNTYGPTETSIVATAHEADPDRADDRDPPIGRPLPNVAVYVVDPTFAPVPVGVPGEMLIGGAGLAAGYLNRPELTAERFVADPFDPTPGARVYRTGDMARRRADGGLEFVGRLDEQVKIRGFRVECGEVEAALARSPMVGQAVVVAPEDPTGDRRLVAYVVASGSELDTSNLRSMLRASLPDHMVPALIVPLAAVPLTVNGKVDRRALPPPGRSGAGPGRARMAPRTATQQAVLGIWAEVLGTDDLGVDDDFFDLGGHSLLAVKVLARVGDTLGVEVGLQALFDSPTVAGLAGAIDGARAEATAPPLIPVPREQGHLALSLAQQRLWFLDQLVPDNPFYNMAAAYRLIGPLEVGVLEQALAEIVARHEALRTTFPAPGGRPFQHVAPPGPVTVAVDDLSGLDSDQAEAEARRLAGAEAVRPFDLARGPLLRARLARLAPAEWVLFITVHHIVSDGWSEALLVKELSVLYGALAAGRPSPLPAPAVQYADFAAWQRQWLEGEVLESHLDYWQARLTGAPPVLELAPDHPRPPMPSYRGDRETFVVPPELAARLRALGRSRGATLYMTLLGAFEVLLARVTGSDDIVVGSTVAGRSRIEIENLIGFFVNSVVLRTNLTGDPPFTAVVERVRAAALEAFEHQDAPFDKVVERLSPARDLSRNPLVQVSFDFEEYAAKPAELGAMVALAELAGYGDEVTVTVDLDLVMRASESGSIEADLTYSVDLYEASTMARLADQYQRLLAAVVDDPDSPISELRLA